MFMIFRFGRLLPRVNDASLLPRGHCKPNMPRDPRQDPVRLNLARQA